MYQNQHWTVSGLSLLSVAGICLQQQVSPLQGDALLLFYIAVACICLFIIQTEVMPTVHGSAGTLGLDPYATCPRGSALLGPGTLRPSEAQCGPGRTARRGLARPEPCPARPGAALGELVAPPGGPRQRLPPAVRGRSARVAGCAGPPAPLGGTFLRTRS